MIVVHTIPGGEWKLCASDAHRAIFGEILPETQKRIDLALLATDSATDDVLAYVTCRELEPTTLYWSFGGVFPSAKGSVQAWFCFRHMLARCKELGYRQIFFLVANTNAGMLKFAAKAGFLIVGLRAIEGEVCLEHTLVLP